MSCPDPLAECDVTALLRDLLREGRRIEIDGLGRFERAPRGGYRFISIQRPRIFIGYVEEDAASALRLFDALAAAGFDPWMDKRKLLPGQNWPRAIEEAIETADFAALLFSTASASKRGTFQSEIRYALDCARRLPLDDAFLLPLRLEPCTIPRRIKRETQYIDLFPDWEKGVRRLLSALSRLLKRRSTSAA
ncbi:MAG: toll/interleukin-1 receptor domain-containing protein [Bryobacterales bacterium]|nr:toll/interleukin-1 receptor domain-containing protein [Bryobacterales bacterium]